MLNTFFSLRQIMFFLFSKGALHISWQVVAQVPCYPSVYILIYKRKGRIPHVLPWIFYPLL